MARCPSVASRSSTMARTAPSPSRTMRPETRRVVDLGGEDGQHVAGRAVGRDERGDRRRRRSSGASPLTSSTGPSRSGTAASATAAACPDPFCSSWTTGSASGAIAARCSSTASRPAPTTTTVAAGAQRLGGGEHVAEQAAAAQRVQHLRRRRAHAGALPGGEDDDGGEAARRSAGDLLRAHGSPRTTGRVGCAGGLGLEPRLHGSKGRRAADYPIPHPRPEAPNRRGTTAAPVGEPRAGPPAGHAPAPADSVGTSSRRLPTVT